MPNFAAPSHAYWTHGDHLGSTAWVTDTAGIGVQHFRYLPFGEPLYSKKTGTFSSRYTFSGKERDAESGLNYFGARYYNSDLSIWISVDPMVDKYPNLSPYTYCANNPVRIVDPDGRDWYEVENRETHEMEIKWTDYKSQADMDNAGLKGTYLGEAFVHVKGRMDERLDANGKLTGAEAIPAVITIYGTNGKDDIQSYKGLSVSSDPSQYSMIATGDYKAHYEDIKDSPYGSTGQSLSYRITNLDGSTKIPTAGGEINKKYPNQGAFMEGIYFHRTNNNGWAGTKGNTAVSKGCIVIDASNGAWKSVEKQLGHSSNIYFRITR